jgi:hypothetical protein
MHQVKRRRSQAGRRVPQGGDVVASRRTARDDVYAITVMPAMSHAVAKDYDDALDTVRRLARLHAVDGWYTCDQTHFIRVAHYRPGQRPERWGRGTRRIPG